MNAAKYRKCQETCKICMITPANTLYIRAAKVKEKYSKEVNNARKSYIHYYSMWWFLVAKKFTVFSQGQWWSIFITHRSHFRQWCDLGALYPSHTLQNCNSFLALLSYEKKKKNENDIFRIDFMCIFCNIVYIKLKAIEIFIHN